MNIKIRKIQAFIPMIAVFAVATVVFNSCLVGGYSFKQGSIPPEIKTVSISEFQNNAIFGSPSVASTFTNTLRDKFTQETRLTQVREDGDISFSGEIVGYTSTPASISAQEQATYNRLTIQVRVRYTNNFDPEASFENGRTFSAFADYPTSQSLQAVEGTLVPEICKDLVDQIFNAALSSW